MSCEGGEIKKKMITNRAKLLTLSATILLVTLVILPVVALAHIGYDCRFFGPVTMNGQNVPGSTVVRAWLEDPYLGPWTATLYYQNGESNYLVNIPMDDPSTPAKDGAVDDEEVYFDVTFGGHTYPAPSATWQRVSVVYHPLRLTTGVCDLWGDANMDGVVNMADVTMVERIILAVNPPTVCADCNQDGEINMADVTCIEIIILTG